MKESNFSKKRIIHIYIVISLIVIILLVAGFFMLKYHVEGEKNLPFKIKKINIISTAESDIKQDDDENWHAGILQENDIFLSLDKNDKYKKLDTIKSIKLENFQIEKTNENMQIKIYRPKSNNFDYFYSEDFVVADTIQFDGGLETNLEALRINNQGCTIGFSIAVENLGEYAFSLNEKVPSDGKLLAKAGLKTEDIKFTISFDLIIETGQGNKFKTTMTLELPTGNILKEGVSTYEDTQLQDIVFKRIK